VLEELEVWGQSWRFGGGAGAGGAGCSLIYRCEDGTGAGGVGWSWSRGSGVELELEVQGVHSLSYRCYVSNAIALGKTCKSVIFLTFPPIW
jgi:hypothetical protein